MHVCVILDAAVNRTAAREHPVNLVNSQMWSTFASYSPHRQAD